MKKFLSLVIVCIVFLSVNSMVAQGAPMEITNNSTCALRVQMVAQEVGNCAVTCTTAVYCVNPLGGASIPSCSMIPDDYEWMYCIVTNAYSNCTVCIERPITKIVANVHSTEYAACGVSYPGSDSITGNVCCDGDNDIYWAEDYLIQL